MALVVEKSILFFFLIIISLAPLPIGANNPMAWNVFAFLIAILVIYFASYNALTRQNLKFPIKRMRYAFIFFSIVCFWIFLQAQPFMPEFIHHPLWAELERVINVTGAHAVSLNPVETETHLMRLITYGMIFFLALQLGNHMQSAEIILKGLAFAGMAYVIYALILWSIGSNTILWYDKWAGQGEVTSTFVNRNHFAAYVGITCIIWLSLWIRELQKLSNRIDGMKAKYAIENIINSFSGVNGLYLLGFLMVFGTLLLTRSRAGFIITLIAILSILLLIISQKIITFKKSKSFGRLKFYRFIISVIAVVTIMATIFSFAGDRVTIRVLSHGIADQQRVNVFLKTYEAANDFKWFGTGYGTFADVFPIYRDETVTSYGRWKQAHNSYIEAVLELGIPGAILFFISIALCFLTSLKGCFTRKKDQYFSQIAVAASILLFLHSAVDFPLQIPAISMTFAALLGLGCSQSFSSRAKI